MTTGKLTLRERALHEAAKVVTQLTGVTLTKMRYGGKCESNCYARALVYFVGHEYLGASYPQVGRFLSKDHTTVIKGANNIMRRIFQRDQELVAHLHHIREKLGMSQHTVTVIKCARCKTTESDGKAKTIDAYVLNESPEGAHLVALRGRQNMILHAVGALDNSTTRKALLTEVAADLCDKCVKVINETLDMLTSTAAEHGVREDSGHFT